MGFQNECHPFTEGSLTAYGNDKASNNTMLPRQENIDRHSSQRLDHNKAPTTRGCECRTRRSCPDAKRFEDGLSKLLYKMILGFGAFA